ncbi:MAG: hypothetical protein P8N50_07965 [Actinomycetota bacterium]|jgi:hypothetical protein|nr:hypothetical protein [Actinomycetota bacterium]
MSNNSRRLTVGAVAVLVVVSLVWLTAATIGSDRGTANLGDTRFADVRSDLVVSAVAEGGPVFYPDLTDGRRDIWITHTGDDALRGFVVLSARAPSGCLVQWEPTSTEFFDICDETIRFPADGGDLDRYPVDVEDGRLIIDLNFAGRD